MIANRHLPVVADDGLPQLRRHGAREVRPRIEKTSTASELDRQIMRAEGSYILDYKRPRTRKDCLAGGVNESRPCPWVGCKHSLFLDVSEKTGNIKFNFPDLEPDEMSADACCALDVVDGKDLTIDDVAARVNLTRERVRQIELGALEQLLANSREDASLAWMTEFSDAGTIGRERVVSAVLSDFGDSIDESDS